MNRVIKFKGKSVDSSEWIKGYYYKECDNTYIIEDRQKVSMLNRNEAVLIDPDSVCQFTGFLDKNGKEIYEGDVLRSDNYPYSCIEDNERDNYYAVVYYCEEGAFFCIVTAVNPDSKVCGISDGIGDDVQKEKMKNFEVVGNIHEEKWQQYGKYFKTEEGKEADND